MSVTLEKAREIARECHEEVFGFPVNLVGITVDEDATEESLRECFMGSFQRVLDGEVLFEDEDVKPAPVACMDCGALYADLGVDLVLPDQVWNFLVPEHDGILCANCICQRLDKRGSTSVLLAWPDNFSYQ